VNFSQQIYSVVLALAVSGCGKSCHGSGAPAACVVDVITGGHATCLRLRDGSYRCRGQNDGSAFTHGEWPGLSASRPWVAMPSQFNSIRLSPGRTCGLDAERTLWCWGRNSFDLDPNHPTEPAPIAMRKFGTGIQSYDANRENTCVVRDGQVHCSGFRRDFKAARIQGLPPDVLWVGVGVGLACAATRREVYCWGRYAWAQPDGSPHAIEADFRGDIATAVQVGTLPDDLAEGVQGAAAGCALTKSRRVYCWGNAHWGEWGTGVITRCDNTPCPEYDFRSLHEVAVVSGSATQLSVGAATFCVTRPDHTVWCWGANNNELVSSRTRYDPERKTMVQVDEPLPVEQKRLGSDNAEVRLGDAHGCVKKLDGLVVCWGSNYYRQVADATCLANACSPRELSYDCSAAHRP